MANSSNIFTLPPNIESMLATLSKLYSREDQTRLQSVVVNGSIQIEEGATFDGWNGGYHGHSLTLLLPETLFIEIAREKESLESTIAGDLNQLNVVENEHISRVVFSAIPDAEEDWRRDSGVLLPGKRVVSSAAESRVWKQGRFRVFLSHISEKKVEVARLKQALDSLGASCFIAHENIQPTEEWQEEIQNALATMDAFVAILTDGFHRSEWTDQEVGYALSRGVPMIAVRLGQDPYGFIGKFQALSCDWQDAPSGIAKLLIAHRAMVDGYIEAIRECTSFDSGNTLATLLPLIAVPSIEQIHRIVEGYNSSAQAQGAFGFNGEQPSRHGPGLLHYLNRWSAQQYRKSRDDTLEKIVP